MAAAQEYLRIEDDLFDSVVSAVQSQCSEQTQNCLPCVRKALGSPSSLSAPHSLGHRGSAGQKDEHARPPLPSGHAPDVLGMQGACLGFHHQWAVRSAFLAHDGAEHPSAATDLLNATADQHRDLATAEAIASKQGFWQVQHSVTTTCRPASAPQNLPLGPPSGIPGFVSNESRFATTVLASPAKPVQHFQQLSARLAEVEEAELARSPFKRLPELSPLRLLATQIAQAAPTRQPAPLHEVLPHAQMQQDPRTHFAAELHPYQGMGSAQLPPRGSQQQGPAAFGVPVFQPLQRPRKKVRSKARILKPGELTMIVYGADEAIKWECRVASFLQAVRVVLGERKLDRQQWQCSILDSVVGAFLTQNVTDALSSKAFMTLAAIFPARPLDEDSAVNTIEHALTDAPDHKISSEEGIQAGQPQTQRCSDSIDWKAVRESHPDKVADAIRCRGMYNFLARRIQAMLDRIAENGPCLQPPFASSLEESPASKRVRELPGLGSQHYLEAPATMHQPSLETPSQAQQGTMEEDISQLLAIETAATQSSQPGSTERLLSLLAPYSSSGMAACKFAGTAVGSSGSLELECLASVQTQPAAALVVRAEQPDSAGEHAALEAQAARIEDYTSAQLQSKISELHANKQPAYMLAKPENQSQPVKTFQDASQPRRDPAQQGSALQSGPEEDFSPLTDGGACLPDGLIQDPAMQSRAECDQLDADQCAHATPGTANCASPQSASHPSAERGNAQISDGPVDKEEQANSDPKLSDLEKERQARQQRISTKPKHPLELEWLKELDVEAARRQLMSIEGLGYKSVACILLLSLGMKDFPVDTNVGRICARLGWLPLEADKALEDLDDYAPEPEVHAYLKDRLMRFKVSQLYELHYQMITLGKVFCSKRDPNCSACPLQDQCEYALSNGRHRKPATRPGANSSDVTQQWAAQSPSEGGQTAEQPMLLTAPLLPKTRPSQPPPQNIEAQVTTEAAEKESAATNGIRSHAQHFAAGTAGDADLSRILNVGTAEQYSDERLGMAHSLGDGGCERPHAIDLDDKPSADCQEPELMTSCDNGKAIQTQDMEDIYSPPLTALLQGRQPEAELLRILKATQQAESILQDPEVSMASPEGGSPSCKSGSAPASAAGSVLRAALDVLDFAAQDSVPAISRSMLAALSAPAIRKRFLELSVLVHPDKNPHLQAEKAFAALKAAYSMLLEHVTQAGSSAAEAETLGSARCERAVELHSNASRVVVEAWEVPRADALCLASTIAAFQRPTDHPLLLIRIPASAGGACRQPQEPKADMECPSWTAPEVPVTGEQRPDRVNNTADLQQASTDLPGHFRAERANNSEAEVPGTPQPSSSRPALLADSLEMPSNDTKRDASCGADGRGVGTSDIGEAPGPVAMSTQDRPLLQTSPRLDLQHTAEGMPEPRTSCSNQAASQGEPEVAEQNGETVVRRVRHQAMLGGGQRCLTRTEEDTESRSADQATSTIYSAEGAKMTACALLPDSPAAASTDAQPPSLALPGRAGPAVLFRAAQPASPCGGMAKMAASHEDAYPSVLNPTADLPKDDQTSILPQAKISDADPGDESVDQEVEGSPEIHSGPRYALLVPCRVAMKGCFPLHGTYFQTNEVFLDHSCLEGPGLQVAEESLQGWKHRLVLFGSSIGSICRGMTQHEVAHLFRRACICVRAYEPSTGMPQHLPAWLQPGGQAPKAGTSRWQPKAKRAALGLGSIPRTPRGRPPVRPRAFRRLRDDGLVLWGARNLRSSLVGKRPGYVPSLPSISYKAGKADSSADDREERALAGIKRRKRSELPPTEVENSSEEWQSQAQPAAALGIKHLLPPNLHLSDIQTLEAAMLAKAPNPEGNGRRRQLLPTIRSSDRCGHCKSCLNPAMKKACFTRRAEMLQQLLAVQEAKHAALQESAPEAATTNLSLAPSRTS